MLSRAVEVTSVEGCFVCRGYECRGLDSSRQYLDSSLDSHADLQHADLQHLDLQHLDLQICSMQICRFAC